MNAIFWFLNFGNLSGGLWALRLARHGSFGCMIESICQANLMTKIMHVKIKVLEK